MSLVGPSQMFAVTSETCPLSVVSVSNAILALSSSVTRVSFLETQLFSLRIRCFQGLLPGPPPVPPATEPLSQRDLLPQENSASSGLI